MKRFKDQKLFEIIFSDADVIDLDFSEWDKLIRLIVVSDHMPFSRSDIRPIYSVEFVKCSIFEMNIAKFVLGMEDDKHCQWNIYDFTLEQVEGGFDVNFTSSIPGPNIHIRCMEFNIEEVDMKVVNIVNPTWSAPYSALARPSMFKISAASNNTRSRS